MPILSYDKLWKIADRVRTDPVFERKVRTVGITSDEDVKAVIERNIRNGNWDLPRPRDAQTFKRIHDLVLSI